MFTIKMKLIWKRRHEQENFVRVIETCCPDIVTYYETIENTAV